MELRSKVVESTGGGTGPSGSMPLFFRQAVSKQIAATKSNRTDDNVIDIWFLVLCS
jgi:hypothetical protein